VPKKKTPPSVKQTISGDDNIQIVGDDNTIRQQVTKYIPLETDDNAVDENVSQNISSATSSATNQTIVGNENIQVIGSNNIIQRIINFFRIDIEQQRALRNRRNMLELVKNTWMKGVLEKSLYNEVLIELGMEEHPGAVDHPWDVQVQMPDKEKRTLPAGTSMMDVFDEMNGAMLILGEPGSGKTTMLLELARDCIERARQDDNQPIPVVFNLSSWNDKQSVDEWLVNELRTKYNVPKKVAEGWVANSELSLLFDGLDEVRQENRETCVKAINKFRQEHGLTSPITVCSRIADYEALTTRLNLSGAVLLQPLTPGQIDVYFAQAGAELDGAHQMLKEDDALQELAKQPLVLSVMTLAYKGKPYEKSESESSGNVETRRRHLFDTYIQEMFERVARTKNEMYPADKTRKWLTWLARKMVAQEKSIFTLEELNAGWLDTIGNRRLFGLIVGALLCIFTALVLGTILGWYIDVSLNLKAGYWIGVGVGVITGLVSGVRSANGRTEIQIERVSWSWQKARRGLVAGIISTIIFGPVFLCLFAVLRSAIGKQAFEAFGSSVIDWGFLMVCCFPFLLITGGLSGLFFGLERFALDERAFPNQGIRRSFRNSFTVALLGGVIFGLFGGFLYGLILGIGGQLAEALLAGLTLGAVSSIVIALFLWLFFGGYVVCVHYLIRVMLYRQGAMPMNYVHFLDYAVERIFLRRVGGGYIFAHRLLMEHFAAVYTENGEP